jgi:glycerol-3-phosphate dehydrogenase
MPSCMTSPSVRGTDGRRAGWRARALEELGRAQFDLLVIGAGIIGSRVAYEAARSGLRVALVESGDFGGATSSASSKLIHGGLRYLPQGNVRLVREAQHERRELVMRIAPHLVRPLPVLLTMKRRWAYGRPAIAGGLFAYGALSGFHRPLARIVGLDEALAFVPSLRCDDLSGCILLPEAQTNDSRLTLATVAAAARAGAVVLNYARVVELERLGGRIVAASVAGRNGEGLVRVRCRSVVNASGPWVDHVRRLEDPRARPYVRLSKGAHIVLPLEDDWLAAVADYSSEAQTTFAAPYNGTLLVGTTDTPYDGDPADAGVDADDVRALVEDARQLLPESLLRPERILFSFAGLRVLPPGAEDTRRARRELLIGVGPAGMVSVAGGKLTTHRLNALDVLSRLPSDLRPSHTTVSLEPLPGGDGRAAPARLRALVDARTFDHLFHLYGTDADRLLDYVDAVPDALEPIDAAGPDIWAQAYYAVEHEWAQEVEDVARRRTTISFRGPLGDGVRARLEAVLTAGETKAPLTATKARSTL